MEELNTQPAMNPTHYLMGFDVLKLM